MEYIFPTVNSGPGPQEHLQAFGMHKHTGSAGDGQKVPASAIDWTAAFSSLILKTSSGVKWKLTVIDAPGGNAVLGLTKVT